MPVSTPWAGQPASEDQQLLVSLEYDAVDLQLNVQRCVFRFVLLLLGGRARQDFRNRVPSALQLRAVQLLVSRKLMI